MSLRGREPEAISTADRHNLSAVYFGYNLFNATYPSIPQMDSVIFCVHYHHSVWASASLHRLLLGRLALRMGGKISGSIAIHSVLRRLSAISRTYLLFYNQFDSVESDSMADLRADHSFRRDAFSVVRVKSSLAPL